MERTPLSEGLHERRKENRMPGRLNKTRPIASRYPKAGAKTPGIFYLSVIDMRTGARTCTEVDVNNLSVGPRQSITGTYTVTATRTDQPRSRTP